MKYCYLIGWTKLNKWYYGVSYRQNSNPSHLWTKYFSSSKFVREFREIHGEPDVISIRKTFNNKLEAINWEAKVLRRLNVKYSDKWLNRHNGDGKFYNKNGHRCTDKNKIKSSERMRNCNPMKNPETARKVGITLSEKRKLGLYKSSINSVDTRQNTSNRMKKYNPMKNQDSINKMVQSKRNNPIIYTCPVCKHTGHGPNIFRYHFKNCIHIQDVHSSFEANTPA